MPGQKLWQCPNTPMTRSNETTMVQVLSALPRWVLLGSSYRQPGESVPSCFAREHVIPGHGSMECHTGDLLLAWIDHGPISHMAARLCLPALWRQGGAHTTEPIFLSACQRRRATRTPRTHGSWSEWEFGVLQPCSGWLRYLAALCFCFKC